MRPAETRRRLEAAYALFQTIEEAAVGRARKASPTPSAEPKFSADELRSLREALEAFANDPRIEVSKLADLTKHLSPELSWRTFHDLMVPIERALEKNIRDDDFLVSTDDLCAPRAAALPLRLVLDDLRSAFNVGSILRSADGLGIERVYLCGYTPGPDETKTRRSALGADSAVAWEKAEDIQTLLRSLRSDGWRVVALETAGNAVPLSAPFPPQPTVFVLGNERFGLGGDRLALCDEIRRLDLQGTKNSLNVAVIAALASYEWRRQWTASS